MSSPHITNDHSVRAIMGRVLFALMPAIAAYAIFFGPAIVINLTLASVAALAAEALMLRLRGVPVKPFLSDGSALLTAWLLALSVPPLAPWWVIITGTVFAIVVAKHLYGGIGNNLFNPAMVGFAILLISFPAYMITWPAPLALSQYPLDFMQTATYMFTGALPPGATLDAINMATPLDTLRTQLALQQTAQDILRMPIYEFLGGKGTMIVSALYLAGGIYLLKQRIITWHIPVAFLLGLFVTAALFWGYDTSRYTPPWFHLFTGGAMLGAFFIATDYVTAPQTPKGKLIYGASIGALIFLIRVFGGYPDAVAFAVLIMNTAVPLLDACTQPRVFGQQARASGEAGK